MPISQPTFKPSDVTVDVANAESIKITNFNILLALTEYSHTLENNLKQLTVKSRSAVNLNLSFSVGQTLINYLSLKKGNVLHLKDLDFNNMTLYMNADASTVVEIVELYI